MEFAVLGQLAQADPAGTIAIPSFVFVLAIIVIGGVEIAWITLFGLLVRHLVMRTIPTLVASFENTNTEERRLCNEQFNLVSAAIGHLTATVSREHPEIIADINNHTTDQMQKYRHDMYDQIHAAVMKRSVEEVKAERTRKEQESREDT